MYKFISNHQSKTTLLTRYIVGAILIASLSLSMGRAPCCDKTKVKKGTWSPEEDASLKNYLEKYGTGGNWIALPHKAG